MTRPSQSVLLDLDGTIVHSEPGILASCRAALRVLGHHPDDLDITNLVGPPLQEVLGEVLARFGDDRVGEAVIAYRDHYGSLGYRETIVYPGLVGVLEQLVALNFRLYVATSKRRVFAQKILEHLGLSELFQAIHGSEPGGAFDRKAELIAHVLKQHSLRTDHSVMVGDRRHDVEGARANAIPTIGVLWGYGDRAELEAAGVAHIVSHPDELVALVADNAALKVG